MGRGTLPKAANPVSTQAVFAGDNFYAFAAAVNHRVFGVHRQDSFNVSSAVGVKPVNRSGHWVKGHIPTYVTSFRPMFKVRVKSRQ
jgi:hypothetical protein